MDYFSKLFPNIPVNVSQPIPTANKGGRPKVLITWKGLNIGIEAQPGDLRHNRIMQASYGHVQNYVGLDGDAIDVYMGIKPASERVFQINQLNPETGLFDEHKFMIWYASLEEAKHSYLMHTLPKMFGGIKEISLYQLEKYKK